MARLRSTPPRTGSRQARLLHPCLRALWSPPAAEPPRCNREYDVTIQGGRPNRPGRPLRRACLLTCLVAAWPAVATNGYFLHGYTAAQRAVAGAGTALAGEVAQLPVNPAGLVGIGEQTALDLNVILYFPSAEVSEPGPGVGLFSLDSGRVRSSADTFFFPFIAYGRAIDASSAWTVALNGGGLKTLYESGGAQFLNGVPGLNARCAGLYGGGAPQPGSADALGFCGRSDDVSSADLTQLFFRAGYARRFGERFSVGLSPIVLIEYFRARGLAAFDDYSVNPGRVTDNGAPHEPVLGYGGRLGLLWSPAAHTSLGASYQTRIHPGRLKDYDGLIPDAESIGSPAMWNLGLAWRPGAAHLLMADFERTNFSDVPPVGRRLDPDDFATRCLLPRLLLRAPPTQSCLGGADGPGFGWRDSLSYKLGYRLALSDAIALSIGYTYTRFPVQEKEVLLSVLAPGVVQDHYALGLGWKLRPGLMLNLAALYSPPNTVKGRNPLSHVDPVALEALIGPQSGGGTDGVFGADAGDQEVNISARVVELVIGVQIGF